mmetsp:Transcript_64722/g.180088  ORF Transcript_64722/g.180088 Transcript_64722/m.180088 type:complete len:258 (-) Transcript_64722:664-1437(-)
MCPAMDLCGAWLAERARRRTTRSCVRFARPPHLQRRPLSAVCAKILSRQTSISSDRSRMRGLACARSAWSQCRPRGQGAARRVVANATRHSPRRTLSSARPIPRTRSFYVRVAPRPRTQSSTIAESAEHCSTRDRRPTGGAACMASTFASSAQSRRHEQLRCRGDRKSALAARSHSTWIATFSALPRTHRPFCVENAHKPETPRALVAQSAKSPSARARRPLCRTGSLCAKTVRWRRCLLARLVENPRSAPLHAWAM